MRLITCLAIFSFMLSAGTATPVAAEDSADSCEQAVLEERSKYDPDGDGKIGLKVAIHALQVTAGLRKSEVPGNCTDSDAWAVIAFSGTGDENRLEFLESFGELTPEWFAVGAISGGQPVSSQEARDMLFPLFTECTREALPYAQIDKTADLFFLYIGPGACGVAAFVDSRNGQAVFVGEEIWMGEGRLMLPEESRRKSGGNLVIHSSGAPDPSELVFLETEFSGNWQTEGNRVWQLARRTYLVRSFAKCGGYKAVVWPYTPRVGFVDGRAARAIVIVTGKTTDILTSQYINIGSATSSGTNNTVAFYGMNSGECTRGYATCYGYWEVDPCNWQSYCSTEWKRSPVNSYTVPDTYCIECSQRQNRTGH